MTTEEEAQATIRIEVAPGDLTDVVEGCAQALALLGEEAVVEHCATEGGLVVARFRSVDEARIAIAEGLEDQDD